jgi:hypothetical protein
MKAYGVENMGVPKIFGSNASSGNNGGATYGNSGFAGGATYGQYQVGRPSSLSFLSLILGDSRREGMETRTPGIPARTETSTERSFSRLRCRRRPFFCSLFFLPTDIRQIKPVSVSVHSIPRDPPHTNLPFFFPVIDF